MPNKFLRSAGQLMIGLGGNQTGYEMFQADQELEAERQKEETRYRRDREDQATEVQRKVFASLYEKAIENGADDDVIQRLESGLGVQIPEGIAGGIGSKIRAKAELDSKRKDFHAILKSGTFTPGSISKAVSSGFDISLLEQNTQTQNNRVLGPGGQLVDPSGKVLATNPNTRPSGNRAKSPELKNIIFPDGRTEAADVNEPAVIARIQKEGGVISGALSAKDRENSERESGLQQIQEEKIEIERQLAEKPNDPNLLSRSAALEIKRMRTSGEIRQTAADKWLMNLRDREAGITSFASIAQKMSERLRQDPDIRTAPGKAAGFFNEVTESSMAALRAATGDFNKEIPPELWDPSKSNWLRKSGIQNAQQKTAILALALAWAKAAGMGEGRALSNADREVALESVGGSSTDPFVIMARAQEAFDNLVEIHKGYLKPFTSQGGIPTTPFQAGGGGLAEIQEEKRRRMAGRRNSRAP